jgi:hypothetical protein
MLLAQGMKKILVLMQVFLWTGVSAASELPDFDPTQGSTAEARRILNADIEDWSDDSASIREPRAWACAWERAIKIPLRAITQPAAPLALGLEGLARWVELTDDESSVADALRNREVSDEIDRLRLGIDEAALRIRVSARLYGAAIREHGAASACVAYSIRMDRNQRLIAATRRALELYDLLERAQGLY